MCHMRQDFVPAVSWCAQNVKYSVVHQYECLNNAKSTAAVSPSAITLAVDGSASLLFWAASWSCWNTDFVSFFNCCSVLFMCVDFLFCGRNSCKSFCMRFFMTGGSSVSGSKMPNCFCNMFFCFPSGIAFNRAALWFSTVTCRFQAKWTTGHVSRATCPTRSRCINLLVQLVGPRSLRLKSLPGNTNMLPWARDAWGKTTCLALFICEVSDAASLTWNGNSKFFLVPDAHRYFLFELQRPGIHHGCSQWHLHWFESPMPRSDLKMLQLNGVLSAMLQTFRTLANLKQQSKKILIVLLFFHLIVFCPRPISKLIRHLSLPPRTEVLVYNVRNDLSSLAFCPSSRWWGCALKENQQAECLDGQVRHRATCQLVYIQDENWTRLQIGKQHRWWNEPAVEQDLNFVPHMWASFS